MSKECKEKYHETLVKYFWLRQRSRHDMQLTSGFQCTRMKCPDQHDWNKLKNLIDYMWYIRYMLLIIGIDVNGDTCVYIDVSHAVHVDGKGYSGMCVTIGHDSMINLSKKLGIVSNSSIETEVVSSNEIFLKCM